MTDKELRHLSRVKLLELLLAQMEENEKLHQQLKETQTALADHRIVIEQAGTLAEAALRLNHVFEDADRAARQYLRNIQEMTQEGRGEL